MSTPQPQVQHDPTAGRFRLVIDGAEAHADYIVEGSKMVCTHTFVPPSLRGQGVAERVVRPMLEEARRRSLRVEPACSYVAAFIQRHTEFHDLLA